MSGQDLCDHARALISDKSAGATLDTGGGDVEAAYAKATTRVEATYTTTGVLILVTALVTLLGALSAAAK